MSYLTEDQLKSEHNEQIQELHRQLNEKDQILQEYRRDHGKLEVFFTQVRNSVSPIEPFDSIYRKTYKARNKVKSPITPVGQGTDSHMGAVQKADEIEFFNEYNPELCKKRNIGFITSMLDWIVLHRNAYFIPKCHMVYTGDLISGDIHDELRVTNAFPAPKQAEAAKVHAQQIALLAPHFEQVIVDFLTEDNHSRLTKKPQAKEAGINSYGYLIAEFMRAYLEKHSNVVFNVHAMHEKVVSISNMNYLLTHLHSVKAWMGIPWYGIERRVAREATARQSLIMKDIKLAKEIGFDKVVGGHFHSPFNSQLYSCGGSVSGTDAYDHAAGRHAKPSQSTWMIHPKHGEFNRTDFDLTRYDK